MLSPIWNDVENFSVIGAAYLLAGEDPPPPNLASPPHVIEYLKRVLRLVKYGKSGRGSEVPSFLDRHSGKPKPFHSGYFLQACEKVLNGDEPILAEFFAEFSFTRPELQTIASAMNLRPAWLFSGDPIDEAITEAIKFFSVAFALEEDFSTVKRFMGSIPQTTWPKIQVALGKRRGPKDEFFQALIQLRKAHPELTPKEAFNDPKIKTLFKRTAADEKQGVRWAGLIFNPERKEGAPKKVRR